MCNYVTKEKNEEGKERRRVVSHIKRIAMLERLHELGTSAGLKASEALGEYESLEERLKRYDEMLIYTCFIHVLDPI